MNWRIWLATATIFAGLSVPIAAAQQEEAPAQEGHILNFEDVELSALIADISTLTGYTFIVHPDARTKRVTVTSATPLSTDAIFEVFLSTLRVHGFTAIPAGRDTYRIVPEEDGVGQAGLAASGTNNLMTEIVHLDHVNALEAAKILKPILDAQGQVIANPGSNTLVVVDYASNMKRIRELVKKIDQDHLLTETIALNSVPASEVQAILSTLHQAGSEEAGGTRFTAVASSTGNSIVIRGDAATVARARAVIAGLDNSERATDTLRVIQLNNATAEEIVPILQQVAAAMDARSGRADTAVPGSTIAHHTSTNSIVISAPSETLMAVERVIGDLDKRRAQVLVEAIIVEMSDDTARELGLQFLLTGTGDSSVPFISTNYSRSAPNLLALTGAITNFGGNDNLETDGSFSDAALSSLLGLSGLSAGVGGRDGDNLFGVILNAVENDTNSRILSKPFNMTLDNGTSSLLVGQEVPVSTGQVLGNDFANSFQTVDRKEIGIKLDVTPRVSDDNTVRLDIAQEISNIAGVVGDVTPDLILNKRNISTTVLADDGEIIVLGGLIEQTDTLNEEKVPLLGDAPVVGRLFRSEGKASVRTNLMVFIRPSIIRSKRDAEAATLRSYSYIRAEELWSGNEGNANSLDAFVTEVLGTPPPQ